MEDINTVFIVLSASEKASGMFMTAGYVLCYFFKRKRPTSLSVIQNCSRGLQYCTQTFLVNINLCHHNNLTYCKAKHIWTETICSYAKGTFSATDELYTLHCSNSWNKSFCIASYFTLHLVSACRHFIVENFEF